MVQISRNYRHGIRPGHILFEFPDSFSQNDADCPKRGRMRSELNRFFYWLSASGVFCAFDEFVDIRRNLVTLFRRQGERKKIKIEINKKLHKEGCLVAARNFLKWLQIEHPLLKKRRHLQWNWISVNETRHHANKAYFERISRHSKSFNLKFIFWIASNRSTNRFRKVHKGILPFDEI